MPMLIAAGAMAVGVAFSVKGSREARSASRRRQHAAIVRNNIGIRTAVQNARIQEANFLSGFTARGAGQGSSAFQSGQSRTKQQLASQVGLNKDITDFEVRALGNDRAAARAASGAAIAKAVASIAGGFAGAGAGAAAGAGAGAGAAGTGFGAAGQSQFSNAFSNTAILGGG